MISNTKILIVGGTQMIGRDFVEFLIEQQTSCEIYLANRGMTNKYLFLDMVKHITIDRNSDCSNLSGMHFDMVIDFSCYNSKQLINVIKNITYNKYIILSTLCVSDQNVLSDTSHWMHNYCKYKRQVEDYIFDKSVKNITIVRPCVLYGMHDYTGRFYENNGIIYWTHNKQPVESSEYYIHVRTFSQYLYDYIDKNQHKKNDIIHINGKGLKIMSEPNKYTIHPYESKYMQIQRFGEPFNYVVIDNLFSKEIYSKLCNKFPSFIARTKPYKDQPGATSNYEGYISGLDLRDLTDGYEFFASKELQTFVEQTFNIKTSKYISPSAHFHKAPSKSGFIHRDMNICSFRQSSPGDQFITTGGVVYTDDTEANPNSVKMMRSIALLYYLNNDDSLESSGGGTGIYQSYSGNLLSTIEPKNNRLFMFEISDNSYHAFIGANFDRSAVVSWFHSSPAYIVHRNFQKFKENANYIEKWAKQTDSKYWSIENDPEYSSYFQDSLSNLLQR